MEMKTVSENGIDVEGREAAKVVSPSLRGRKGRGKQTGARRVAFAVALSCPFGVFVEARCSTGIDGDEAQGGCCDKFVRDGL